MTARSRRKYLEQKRAMGYDIPESAWRASSPRQLRSWVNGFAAAAGLVVFFALIGAVFGPFTEGGTRLDAALKLGGFVILAYLWGLAISVVFGVIYVAGLALKALIDFALFK